MKKESIIAILFGVAFGGLVAFVLISKNKELQMDKAKTLTPNVTTSPTTTSLGELSSLEISSPADSVIVAKNTVTISGKTNKNSVIVIQSPIKDLVLQNKEERFQTDFPLALGENVIKIVVYPKDTKLRPQERELKIYYLEE